MKKLINKLVLLNIGIFVSISLNAQLPSYNHDQPIPIDKNVIKGKLDNGFTYYIRSNKRPENRAELTIIVNAGSIHEDDDQQGLAHFCEHMAFNGTKNFKKNELVNYLESIGMKFGPEINAYTSFDQTVYGIKVPLNRQGFLDTGLMILADWAHNISFEAEEIEKERGVIHEEWRMGRGADERMMKQYLPVLFHQSQYAKRLPIGKIEIIDNFKHDVIKRFYKDWYRPDLMAIVVVGDFDAKAVEQKVKTVFSAIPKPLNPREQKVYEIPNHDQLLVSVAKDKEAEYSLVQIYYKHPMFIEKNIGDYRQSIVHQLFNSMINKRLDELRQQENPPFIFGYSAYSSFLGPKDMYMSVAMTANNNTIAGLQTLMEENERVKRYGFTETEFEREKKSLLKEIENSYNERNKVESEKYVSEYVRNFGMNQEPIPGIELEYELYKKFIPEITLQEVNKLANEWITDKNRVIIVTGPDKEDVKLPEVKDIYDLVEQFKNVEITAYVDKVSDLPLIDKLPAKGKVKKVNKNKKLGYEEWNLGNGAKVILKQTDFKDNEVLFYAFSEGGNSLYSQKDDVSAEVAASVFAASGISTFDKIELDKKLSDKVVYINPFIDELYEGFEGQCAPQDIESMLQLVYLYFSQPRLSKEAFSSFVTKKKAEYENSSTSPETVWIDTIKSVKTQYHPRRRPWTTKTIDEADYKRIDKIFKERFADPNNFTFIFVGNFNSKTLKPLIEQYIGSFQVLNRNETWKDLGIRPPTNNIDKTVYKGQEDKSYVYISYAGNFDYSLEKNIEIKILNSILSTRLLEVVREDKSGTYSIGAYSSTKRIPTPLYDIVINFGCAPNKVEELTKLVNEEINKLKTEGPTEIDLAKAKEKEMRERETDIKKNNFWINEIEDIYKGNALDTDINDFEKIVQNIKQEDIKLAAQKYFNNNVRVVLKPEN